MGLALQSFMAAQFQGEQLNASLDEKKAATAFREQQTANAKMQNMMQQKQLDEESRLSAAVKQMKPLDGAAAASSSDDAKMYQKLASDAMGRGDLWVAEKLTAHAKASTDEALKEQKFQKEKQQEDMSEVSAAAQVAMADPSSDNNKALIQASLKAGFGMNEVPRLGTPEFVAWTKKLQTAGMTGQKILERTDKLEKIADDRTERQGRDKERQANMAAARAATAASREQANVSRIQSHALQDELTRARITALNAQKDRMDIGGAPVVRMHKNTVAQGAEIVRNLANLTKFPSTETAGVFSNVTDDSALHEAIVAQGGRKVTPAIQQMFQVAQRALALEGAQMSTNMGGRGPNQAIMKEMKAMAEVEAGDTQVTALYKMANIAEFVRLRESLVDRRALSEEETASRAQTMKFLNQFPLPARILQMAQDSHQTVKGKLQSRTNSLMQELSRMSNQDAAIPQSQKDLFDKLTSSGARK